MKHILTSVAAVSLLLSSCGARPELSILHVNDTHSHLEADRSSGRGGVIERAAIVDSVRLSRGRDNVLLLHAGDFNQGTSYYTELKGEAELAAFNAMGYDCLALGNHEFDGGQDNLASRLSRLNCPVVCANLDFKGCPIEPYVTPYTVITKGGRRIGIIGLMSDVMKNISSRVRGRITQLDAVESVSSAVSELSARCDMIIILSHMGLEADKDLVSRIRGVDLVVGGHSHTYMEDFFVGRDLDGKPVRIISDGMFGFEIGEIIVKQ